MKRFLKICDLYGTQFHWFYEYKPKYYSYYGGIFSILTVISWFFIFVTFIFHDINKNLSISNTSTLPPKDYKSIKFGKQKLYLPWRITDYNERFINHKGILYPKIYYFSNKLNNKSGLMETYYNIINYSLCNETSMKHLGNDVLLDISIDNLYCIDMEDLDLGGTWNSEFINYIRFDLYLCRDGIDYNESNYNCTSHDYLIDKIGKNNNWYFELLYPVIQFQPTVKKIPILVFYKTYYYGLNLNSNKLDRIYIQEHIMEDQQGWIFDEATNKSYWGISSIQGDNYSIQKRDPVRYGSTSRLYSLKFYLDYSTIYYTRKSKKLFETLGEAFPIVNVIYTIFSFISGIFNELIVNKKLNEFVIYNSSGNLFQRKKAKIGIRKNKSNKSISVTKLTNNININKKSIQEILVNKNSNLKKIEDSSKADFLLNNSNNNITDINNNIKLNLNTNKRNKIPKRVCNTIININRTYSEIFDTFNREDHKFPLKHYFFGFCLNKINSKNKNNYLCISKKFNKSFKFYTRIIDITSYISLYKQFELIKNELLNLINSKQIESNRSQDNHYDFYNKDNKFKKIDKNKKNKLM